VAEGPDGGNWLNGDSTGDGARGPGRARQPMAEAEAEDEDEEKAEAWLTWLRPTISGGEPQEVELLGSPLVGVDVREDNPSPSMSRDGVGLSTHGLDVPWRAPPASMLPTLPVSQLPSLVVLAALLGRCKARRQRPTRLLAPRVPRPTLLKTEGRTPIENAGDAPGEALGEPSWMSEPHVTIAEPVSTPSCAAAAWAACGDAA